jgi:hypothetical protein
MTVESINLLTIILISLSFICIGGTLYDLNTHQKNQQYQQSLYWPLAIGFSTAGGSVILGLFLKHFLPSHILNEMIDIKQYRV